MSFSACFFSQQKLVLFPKLQGPRQWQWNQMKDHPTWRTRFWWVIPSTSGVKIGAEMKTSTNQKNNWTELSAGPLLWYFSSYISVLDLIQLVCCLVCSTLFLRVRWFNAVMSLSSFNSCRTNNFKSSSLNSEDEGPSNSNIEDEENPSIILTIFKVPRCHRWSLPRVTFSRSKIQMIRCLIHMKSSGLRRTALGDCSYM